MQSFNFIILKQIKKYNITLLGKENEEKKFEFNIDDSFFQLQEDALVEKGDLIADVSITAKVGYHELNIAINGSISVPCDRCLDLVEFAIDANQSFIIKIGEENISEDENIIFVSEKASVINVAEYIYEIVCLNLPYRILHGEDSEGNTLCNEDMLSKIDEYAYQEKEPEVDSRWSDLKKLLDKN